MKKLFLFTLAFSNLQLVFPQTSPPQTISYQGIARDASGNILSVQPIGIQFILHQGSMTGTPVFSETHATTTNSLGLFTLEIGKNNPTQFQSIDWSNGPYFLEVQMDPTGGTSYTYVGTQQLLSVPYALYAKNSYSANTSYSASYALGSYSTANAPPFTFTSSSTPTGATFTLTQGSNTATTSISFPPPSIPTISMFSSGIASVTPSSGNAFTVHVDAPNFTSTNGITTITGTYPNYTVSTPAQSLSIVGTNSLAITNGNTVTLPPSSVSISGAGITTVSATGGSVFTVGTPSPSFANGTGINVNGTYPNYTITNTAPNQTVNITPSNTVVTVSGAYPNYAIGVVTPTFANGGITTVTGTYPNYTISTPAPSLNVINGSSQATISVSQGTATSTKTLTFPASNVTITPSGIAAVSPTTGNNFNLSVPAPTLSATSNITGIITLTINQGSASDTATIDVFSSIKNNAWALVGNSGTNPPTNFLGTTDAKDLVFKTFNFERMRIASNGNIGIGTPSPFYPLHTSYTGTNTSVHHIDYTSTSSTGANSGIYVDVQNTGSGNIFGGYFRVYNSNTSTSSTAVKAFNVASSALNYGIEASATGTTSSGTNYGVWGSATGGGLNIGVEGFINGGVNGYALYGVNQGTGYAGKFEVLNSSNPDPAVYITTQSKTALEIYDGHIKASSSMSVPTPSITYSGSVPPSNVSIMPGSNDVRGKMRLQTLNSSLVTITSGSYYKIDITFAKSYNTPPFVILSPEYDSSASSLGMRLFDVMSGNVTTTGFSIYIYYSDAYGINTTIPPNHVFLINYFIIE